MSLQTGMLSLSELEGTQGSVNLGMAGKRHIHSYCPFRSPGRHCPSIPVLLPAKPGFKLDSFYS